VNTLSALVRAITPEVSPGLSLHMFRCALGYDPHWGSCRAVIDKYRDDMQRYSRHGTPIGAVLWWETMHGNCAIYVGDGFAMWQWTDGRPMVSRVSEIPGDLVGWTVGIPESPLIR